MFDNSIFASFVPQLLMLLGYLSCFLAPIIPTLSAFNADLSVDESKYTTNEVAVSYTSNLDQNEAYNYFDIQYDVEFEEYIELSSIIVSTTLVTVFCENTLEFKSDWFVYSQFSRPPPFSC